MPDPNEKEVESEAEDEEAEQNWENEGGAARDNDAVTGGEPDED
ncbi:MAG TPA: hypothetical protein VI791_01645 [Patescibacteria group bacterium]|nr:hypothetical protein [Patescibacteria group bacterium]